MVFPRFDNRGESTPLSRKRLTRLLSALRPGDPGHHGLPETLTGAAALGDLGLMQAFLEGGADPGERTPGFASPLVAASAAGQVEAVRFLLARGATLRPKDAVVTPVQAAVMNGHVEMVRVLLEAGSTLEEAAAGLPGACASGFYPVVEFLVGAGLDLDRPGSGGRSLRERAVDAARMAGRRSLVSYLREQAVDPEEIRQAPTALDERRTLQARLAKDRGEAPLTRPEEREERIQEAVAAVHSAGEGASAWTTDDGEPLLAVAAGHGLDPIVQALLASGADPGAAAAHSLVTPLIRAAEGGQKTIVHLLLAREAEVNAQDAEGRTALAAAAEHGDPELVRLLLAAGADPARRSADGRTPAARARGPFVREIRAMLPPEPTPEPAQADDPPEEAANAMAPEAASPIQARPRLPRKKAR
jgi:ankyrin repeat protein